MPPTTRIRLRVEERQAALPCRYREPTDPPGTSRLFPFLQLRTLARAERTGQPPNPGYVAAIIDTGAWISAIETDTWQDFDRLGLIEHLPFAGAGPGPALVGGGSSAYRLGRLWLSLHDLQPPVPGRGLAVNWLPAVPVIAQLLLDPACQLPQPQSSSACTSAYSTVASSRARWSRRNRVRCRPTAPRTAARGTGSSGTSKPRDDSGHLPQVVPGRYTSLLNFRPS